MMLNGNTEQLLKEFKEIRKSLPLDNLKYVINGLNNSEVKYISDEGEDILGYGLFKTDLVAVQRALMLEGTTIAKHHHPNSKEWLIVFEGELILLDDKGKEIKRIGVGDHIIFEPNEPHRLKTNPENGDTWMIAITIPADEGYPNAR